MGVIARGRRPHYVRTWAGFVHDAFVVDWEHLPRARDHAQAIVGWHAMTTKRVDLVLICLWMGTWARGHHGHPVSTGSIFHSDAGSGHTALHFTEHLAIKGIAPFIGSVGDAYDNALMESVIGLHKTECIRPGPFHHGPLKTISGVEYATASWVEWWNTARLHSTIDDTTPAEHEAAHYAATTATHPEPRPV